VRSACLVSAPPGTTLAPTVSTVAVVAGNARVAADRRGDDARLPPWHGTPGRTGPAAVNERHGEELWQVQLRQSEAGETLRPI